MIRASVGTSTFPSRSNRARSRLGITIASISILIALTSQLFGQALPPTAPLQQGALYLQTGVIYTETLTGPDPAAGRSGLHKKPLHVYGTLRLHRASLAVALNPMPATQAAALQPLKN